MECLDHRGAPSSEINKINNLMSAIGLQTVLRYHCLSKEGGFQIGAARIAVCHCSRSRKTDFWTAEFRTMPF